MVTMPNSRPQNPFRIHGMVGGEFCTEREAELIRFINALSEPTSKLLVSGPRRTGKTCRARR